MAASRHELSDTLARIAEAIASLQYGAVHITVHDSRVVQIEKVEKIWLKKTPHADLTSGGAYDTSSRADRTAGSSERVLGH